MGKPDDVARVESVDIPPQYRKARKASKLGALYDVVDVEDPEVRAASRHLVLPFPRELTLSSVLEQERRLLYKLDAVLVTFMSAGYFLKVRRAPSPSSLVRADDPRADLLGRSPPTGLDLQRLTRLSSSACSTW